MSKMNEVMFSKSILSKDINKIELLKADEEKALIEQAQKGDISARNRLVEANLRFIISEAKRYMNMGVEMDELVAEGATGLIHAIEKFDISSKNKLITYAAFWIRCTIQKAIRETGKIVRFPDNKYSEMQNDKWNFASLDAITVSEDGENKSYDSWIMDTRNRNPEEQFLRDELVSSLHRELKNLLPNERMVISLYFGLDNNDPLSYSEISKILGKSYTREGVRQIALRAINKLRNQLVAKGYENISDTISDNYWDMAA